MIENKRTVIISYSGVYELCLRFFTIFEAEELIKYLKSINPNIIEIKFHRLIKKSLLKKHRFGEFGRRTFPNICYKFKFVNEGQHFLDLLNTENIGKLINILIKLNYNVETMGGLKIDLMDITGNDTFLKTFYTFITY